VETPSPQARASAWQERNLSVTANTYTHVLADETEVDYRALVR